MQLSNFRHFALNSCIAHSIRDGRSGSSSGRSFARTALEHARRGMGGGLGGLSTSGRSRVQGAEEMRRRPEQRFGAKRDDELPTIRAHLCLGSYTIAAIDPDVFRHNGALLVELQIFLELQNMVSALERGAFSSWRNGAVPLWHWR